MQLHAPVETSDLRDLLVCPICKSSLSYADERIRCAGDAGCRGSKDGFPVIRGTPALIDFDRSIISEAALHDSDGNSAIVRGSRIWRRLSYTMHNLSGIQGKMDAHAALFLDVLRQRSGFIPAVLIVGAGTLSPNSPFRSADGMHIVQTDIYRSPSTTILADGHSLPFQNECFDGIAIQYVLEHVLDPAMVVSEIHRVLKPGGVVYAETSFMEQVHEAAFDFTRFTHSGHRWLFRNFDEICSGIAGGPANAFLWSSRYLVRGIARTKIVGIIATLAMFWVHLLDKIIPAAFAYDSATGVFFIGSKGTSVLRAIDMIAYYRGAGRR